jgi:mannose-6-phosphate isomerase-like protein (cupin superfamily)
MALEVRRVVTGHDAKGKAIVLYDGASPARPSMRPGTENTVVWTTQGFPVDNNGDEDGGRRETGTTLGGGTVFRVLRLEPNNAQRVHRTDSIDYAIVMSGEIDMELETGEETHLKEGDVIVQRGTIHNWINRGTEPCQIAFVLIDAKPVVVNGKVLEAKG